MLNTIGFLERPDGVAFWTMVLFSFAFLVFSYAIAQVVEWSLLFLIIVAALIFRSAWTIYAWRRPSSIEIEKAERASFWTTSIALLIILTLEYTTTHFFSYYVLYVFVAGLVTKYFVSFLSYRRKIGQSQLHSEPASVNSL
jgi:hypothetical protein